LKTPASTRGKIIISLHIDDGLYMSTDDSLTQDLIRKLEDRFGKVKHTEGDNLSFLGLNIKKEEDGNITLASQPSSPTSLKTGTAPRLPPHQRRRTFSNWMKPPHLQKSNPSSLR
jgi:hypothetical protein